ncbi:MAG: hypothetical protein Q9165_008505 [Trypethelium subeluteriae]
MPASSKRPLSEQHPLCSGKLRKKQKLDCGRAEFHPISAFWDTLSKIWLTKDALRELDRRDIEAATHLGESSPPHRPITRNYLTGARVNLSTEPTGEYLDASGDSERKRIQQFARQGGPDLSDLKGFTIRSGVMSSCQSTRRRSKRTASTSRSLSTTSTTATKKTGSSGTYNPNFEQKLIDGGIYPYGYDNLDSQIPPKPANWSALHARFTRPRRSLSPSVFSEEDHEAFVQADARASREKSGVTRVIPYIEGELSTGEYPQENVLFANLEPLVPSAAGGSKLPFAKPDFYHGARPEQLHHQVRDDLNTKIIPSRQDSLPAVPNFFLEVKGPSGTAVVARRQACYNGALGARAIHTLQSYRLERPVYDNNAYTISSTYNDGTLKVYAHHPRQPHRSRTQPEYYMHQVGAFAVTHNADIFRQGATVFRNARDWTEEQRQRFIAQANARVGTAAPKSMEGSSSQSITSMMSVGWDGTDSETSADELSQDTGVIKRQIKSLEQSRRNRSRQTSGVDASMDLTSDGQPQISSTGPKQSRDDTLRHPTFDARGDLKQCNDNIGLV